MTVGELRHGRGTPMSSAEFVDWLAFEELEWEDKVDAINNGKLRPVVIVDSVNG